GRPVRHRPDAQRGAGGDRVHRRGHERRPAGGPDAGHHRRSAGQAVGRPAAQPMIPRYSLPEMAALFTDEARLALWLEIEVLATEAWAILGVVPEDDAKAVRERAPAVDSKFVEAVAEREAVTDHDVAAFVDVVQAAIGPPAAGWVHYGLTS